MSATFLQNKLFFSLLSEQNLQRHSGKHSDCSGADGFQQNRSVGTHLWKRLSVSRCKWVTPDSADSTRWSWLLMWTQFIQTLKQKEGKKRGTLILEKYQKTWEDQRPGAWTGDGRKKKQGGWKRQSCGLNSCPALERHSRERKKFFCGWWTIADIKHRFRARRILMTRSLTHDPCRNQIPV